MGIANIPENIGVILHLSALAEVILQRKLNGKHVNTLQLLENILGTDCKNLFDPKRQSLLIAGFYLNLQRPCSQSQPSPGAAGTGRKASWI